MEHKLDITFDRYLGKYKYDIKIPNQIRILKYIQHKTQFLFLRKTTIFDNLQNSYTYNTKTIFKWKI